MAKGIFFSRLNQLLELIKNYSYPEPLNLYLKKYFKLNKKLGSRDRKQVKAWFYLYFKSNHISENTEQELLILLQEDNSAILEPLRGDLDKVEIANSKVLFPLQELISPVHSEKNISEFKSEKLYWVRSTTNQTDALQSEGDIYGFKQGAEVNQLQIRQVQDLASFKAAENSAQQILKDVSLSKLEIWDACAGAGGKSLALLDLMNDQQQQIQLFTSDIRPQMERALSLRLLDAGYQNQKSGVLNLEKPLKELEFGDQVIKGHYFDAIVLDAPCSGSGTWGRNAQHLRFFKKPMLQNYIQLQKSIVANVLPFLKPEGKLFYITCSIYADENEKQLESLCKEHNLTLVEDKYFGNSFSDQLYWACLQLNQ